MKITCFSLSRTSLLLVALLLSLTANSYDIETHAKLTNEAFSQSQLSSDQLQKRLGIDSWMRSRLPSPFNIEGGKSAYFDVSGTSILRREYLGYEKEIISGEKKLSLPDDPFKLNGWMMSGVIREDDTASITGAIIGGPPKNLWGQRRLFCEDAKIWR